MTPRETARYLGAMNHTVQRIAERFGIRDFTAEEYAAALAEARRKNHANPQYVGKHATQYYADVIMRSRCIRFIYSPHADLVLTAVRRPEQVLKPREHFS